MVNNLSMNQKSLLLIHELLLPVFFFSSSSVTMIIGEVLEGPQLD